MQIQLNKMLDAFNTGEFEDIGTAIDILLPVENIIKHMHVDIHLYANALLKANLVQPALQ